PPCSTVANRLPAAATPSLRLCHSGRPAAPGPPHGAVLPAAGCQLHIGRMPPMQPRSRFVPLLLATLLLLVVAARPPARTAQPVRAQVTVDAGAPGATIPRTLFGLFFEDSNFAADGGLSPERGKNRSFGLPDPLMGWKKAEARGGSFEIRTDRAISANNTRYLRPTT